MPPAKFFARLDLDQIILFLDGHELEDVANLFVQYRFELVLKCSAIHGI